MQNEWNQRQQNAKKIMFAEVLGIEFDFSIENILHTLACAHKHITYEHIMRKKAISNLTINEQTFIQFADCSADIQYYRGDKMYEGKQERLGQKWGWI